MRDLNPSDYNWIDDAIEWMGEALEHIGSSPQVEKKVCALNVKDYTACLPADLYYINMVGVNPSVSTTTANEIKEINTRITEIKAILDADPTQEVNTELFKLNSRLAILDSLYWSNPKQVIPLAYATSEFPNALHCDKCINMNTESQTTYFINAGKIKTSFETGVICLSYTAFPTDEDCYPMIPDDISFKEAMFWYVYKKLILRNPNFKPNGIDFPLAEGQWKYYCTQARNAANYPDIAKMESFLNQWVRLIPNISNHDEYFNDLNAREELNRNLE
tara:strand:- start:33347 stop:34174 length:828 start_codon:yes stop_codon:yes gene_type:complete